MGSTHPHSLSKTEILFFRVALISCMAAILYLATADLSDSHMPKIWDKLQHMFAFWVLAGLSDYAFPSKPFNMTKIFALIAFGVLIECIQLTTPHREFSLLDVFADTIGAMLYIPCQGLLKRLPWLKNRFNSLS